MVGNINQLIAENIRKIRSIKGLDAKAIADHLSISTSAYTRMERGETQIDIERIATIAQKLGVSSIDILSFKPDSVFEKVNKHNFIGEKENATVNNQSGISKEVLDSLTNQLKIKDEQLKQLHETLQKLIERLG